MPKLSKVEVDVLMIVRQEVRATPKIIANKKGCSDVYARQLCWRLVKTGHLNRVARGVYELTGKGEAAIPGVKGS